MPRGKDTRHDPLRQVSVEAIQARSQPQGKSGDPIVDQMEQRAWRELQAPDED